MRHELTLADRLFFELTLLRAGKALRDPDALRRFNEYLALEEGIAVQPIHEYNTTERVEGIESCRTTASAKATELQAEIVQYFLNAWTVLRRERVGAVWSMNLFFPGYFGYVAMTMEPSTGAPFLRVAFGSPQKAIDFCGELEPYVVARIVSDHATVDAASRSLETARFNCLGETIRLCIAYTAAEDFASELAKKGGYSCDYPRDSDPRAFLVYYALGKLAAGAKGQPEPKLEPYVVQRGGPVR